MCSGHKYAAQKVLGEGKFCECQYRDLDIQCMGDPVVGRMLTCVMDICARARVWPRWFLTLLKCSFVALGILASSAYPGEMKENVLAVMSGPRASAVTKVCVSVFALFSVAPSIAVRSIMIRLNMTLMPR